MTSNGFPARYRPLQQVTEGSVKTFHAMARSGAVVMVHLLEGTAQERGELLALIERLGPEERQRVLDVQEEEDRTVVITRFFLEFDSLRRWLEASARRPSPSPTAPGTAPPPAPAPPEAAETEAAPPSPPPQEPRRVETPREEPAPAQRPGEFTLLFEAPQLDASLLSGGEASGASRAEEPAADPPPAADPAPSARDDGTTGEFSRLFRVPTETRRAAPPPPAVSDAFTDFQRLFGDLTPHSESEPPPAVPPAVEASEAAPPPAPLPLAEPPLPPSRAVPAAERPAPEEELFPPFSSRPEPPPASAWPAAPSASSPPPQVDYRESYLDRLHESTPPPAAGRAPLPFFESSAAGAPREPPPAPPFAAGPSEYSRVISAVPPLPLEPAPPPVLAEPPPPPRAAPSRLPILIALGLVLLAALALLLYFFLRAAPAA